MPLNVKRTWNACGEAFDRFTSAEDSFSDNIERPAVRRLIGEVAGKRVLDLGCGSGTYSVWFAQLGAQVAGLDVSQTMIELAFDRARRQGAQIDFRVADIREPLPFGDEEFDLIFTGTALHYVDDLESTMKEAARVMKRDGSLVASVLHPVSTARFQRAGSEEIEGPDPWEGRYFGSRLRCIETPWVAFGEVPSEGRRIFCNHHTISDYFGAVVAAGLTITQLLEPEPPEEFAEKNADRYDEAMRLPVFLIFKAEKKC